MVFLRVCSKQSRYMCCVPLYICYLLHTSKYLGSLNLHNVFLEILKFELIFSVNLNRTICKYRFNKYVRDVYVI